MAAALALAGRGRARSYPNPNVGCLIVTGNRVVGRGWTQPGGRPHAEAMALAQAGDAARGSTAYVTLEPCAHDSARGGSCADALIAAGIVRVVIAVNDPDPRTNGAGAARLRDAGVAVESGVMAAAGDAAMAGWLMRQRLGRPFVTLKLATSLDGCIARADGESQWITGPAARAHAHLERARSDAILVGRGTWEADAPKLDVRLPGLEERSPQRVVLTSIVAPAQAGAAVGVGHPLDEPPPACAGATLVESPAAIANLQADWLLVEGGAQTAASFLREDLVDRLLLYRAPITIGGGKASLGDIGLASIAEAHGQWRRSDTRTFGPDTLEIYERV